MRKSIYSPPVHVNLAIIIIVSLGARMSLISLEHVLACDKLVNHLIMGSFLILEHIPKPWFIHTYKRAFGPFTDGFNNLNWCWNCISCLWYSSLSFSVLQI